VTRRARPASLRNPHARVARIQTNRPPARAASIATPRHRHGMVPGTHPHHVVTRVIARTHLIDVHVVVIVFAPIDRWSLTLVLVFIVRGGVAVGARAAFHGCVATRCVFFARCAIIGARAGATQSAERFESVECMVEVFLNCFGTKRRARIGNRLAFRGVPALMRDVWLNRNNDLHGTAIGLIRGEALGDATLLTGFDDEL
jgi:hypothetical protein